MNIFNRVTQPLTWLMALLLTAFVVGCGSSGGDAIVGGGGSSAGTTAPTVLSTVPLDVSTGIALNASVTAIFSELMNPATIVSPATSFTLTGPAGAVVAGVVTYVGSTATFTPTSNLAASTVYTAAITTGVTDLAGNALAVTKTWSFTTGLTADVTPPTVLSTVPLDTTTGIATNASVTALFSELMNPATIVSPATSFTLTGPAGAVVAGAVTYAGSTATFTPTSNLAASTVYTATLTTAVKDLAGNAMVANKTWSFTTGVAPDTTPPTVLTTVPASGVTVAIIPMSITATFSELMNPLALNASPSVAFTLAGPGTTNVPGAVTYTTGTTATFTPFSALVASTVYTATISTAVKDLAGNTMVLAKTWSFTTAAAAPTTVLPGAGTNPTVLSSSPTNGDINVPTSSNSTIAAANNTVTGKLVIATFSEAMTAVTITTPGTFTLYDNTIASGVPGTVTMNAANTMGHAANMVATFTPTAAALTPSHNYTATITTAARTSAANTPITQTVAWSFTTKSVALTGQEPVDLLSILTKNFVILSKTGITGSGNTITGNIGVSSTTGASITVACTDLVAGAGIGQMFTDDGTPTGTCHILVPADTTTAFNAVADMGTAYIEAGGRTNPTPAALASDITNLTLNPGIHTTAGGVLLNVGTGAGVTLDCLGDSNAVFIFQIATTLTVGPGAPVTLAGSCQAKNIFWVVQGAAVIDTPLNTTSKVKGNLLTLTTIALQAGATINGRLLSQTNVTLNGNTVGP